MIYPPRTHFASPTLTVGAKVECRLPFMAGSALQGEVIATSYGRYLVETTEGGRSAFYAVDQATMKDQEGDPWTRVEPTVTEWFNVYDDLTIGTTAHKSWEAAVVASKYGKTRIGIVERTRRGTAVVSSKVHQTTPQRRSAANTRGVNPYA